MNTINWPEPPTVWEEAVVSGYKLRAGRPIPAEASAIRAAKKTKDSVAKYQRHLNDPRSANRDYILAHHRKRATDTIDATVTHMKKKLSVGYKHFYRAPVREFVLAMQQAVHDAVNMVPEPPNFDISIENVSWSGTNRSGTRRATAFTVDPPDVDIDRVLYRPGSKSITIMSDDNLHAVMVEIEGVTKRPVKLRQRLSNRGDRHDWWPSYDKNPI